MLKRDKHNWYTTWFYGRKNGTWDDLGTPLLGFGKYGYEWELTPGMSSKNDYRNLCVEGATQTNIGFLKALQEIVILHPELADFVITFDGSPLPVRRLLGDVSVFAWRDIAFYHGTSSAAWAVIAQTGLRPRSETNLAPVYGASVGAKAGRQEAIYLTTQLTMAHFAAFEASRVSGSDPTVLIVTGLDGRYMLADEDSQKNDARESLDTLGSVAYVGTISPVQVLLYQCYIDRCWRLVES